MRVVAVALLMAVAAASCTPDHVDRVVTFPTGTPTLWEISGAARRMCGRSNDRVRIETSHPRLRTNLECARVRHGLLPYVASAMVRALHDERATREATTHVAVARTLGLARAPADDVDELTWSYASAAPAACARAASASQV